MMGGLSEFGHKSYLVKRSLRSCVIDEIKMKKKLPAITSREYKIVLDAARFFADDETGVIKKPNCSGLTC